LFYIGSSGGGEIWRRRELEVRVRGESWRRELEERVGGEVEEWWRSGGGVVEEWRVEEVRG